MGYTRAVLLKHTLRCLLIAMLCLPAAAENSWESAIAGKPSTGPSPFRTYNYKDGLLTLQFPVTWRVHTAIMGREEQLLLLPPSGSPVDPQVAYLLLMVRLPPGKLDKDKLDKGVSLVTDKMKNRLIAADKTGRTQVARAARDITWHNRPAREYELAGMAGTRKTRILLRGAITDQAALTMIQIWPTGSNKPYRKLFAFIDKSLQFKSPEIVPRGMGQKRVPFIGHGWKMQIPERWAGNPITFAGSPAYTLAHKRLLTESDPEAVRMIVATMSGAKLGQYDAAGLASNLALNLRKQNPTLKVIEEEKDWPVAGLPGVRIVLRGQMQQSGLKASVWVVVGKSRTRAYMTLVLAGQAEMDKAGAELEKMLKSLELVADDRQEK